MFLQDVAKPVFDVAKTELFEKFEKAFIILYLILYSKGVITLLLTGGSTEGDGAGDFDFGILKLFWLINYLITASLFVVKWDVIKDRLAIVVSSNYFYWVFLMFLFLSTIWSYRPDETIKASIAMCGTVLFGVYIVCRYSLKEQIKLFLWFFGIVISLSILFMLIPGYGIDMGKHAGAVRGIYSHKNIAGQIAVLSSATFLICVKGKLLENQKLAYLGFTLSLAMVIASKSSSSLLYALVLIALINAIQVLSLRGNLFVWSLVSLGGLYFLVSTWAETIMNSALGLVGKDATFSGRTDIWDVIIDKIQEELWLGYGFDGFWHGIYGESLYVRNALRWNLPNSHNGYLDLTLGIGIVGAALLALVIWVTFVKGLAVLKTNFSWANTWGFIYIFYLLMINMSESSLGSPNSLQTIFMTISIVTVSVEFSNLFSTGKLSNKTV